MKDVTETEIQRTMSVVLAPNRLITNSVDFPTKDTRQHPSGLEYLWPPDVQGLLLHVFDQALSLYYLDRDEDTHSSQPAIGHGKHIKARSSDGSSDQKNKLIKW